MLAQLRLVDRGWEIANKDRVLFCGATEGELRRRKAVASVNPCSRRLEATIETGSDVDGHRWLFQTILRIILQPLYLLNNILQVETAIALLTACASRAS